MGTVKRIWHKLFGRTATTTAGFAEQQQDHAAMQLQQDARQRMEDEARLRTSRNLIGYGG